MITTDTHVFFYSGREIYSNWHRTPGQILEPVFNTRFDSSEQAFMAAKARFFGDHEALCKIVEATDPRTAKELGRKVVGYDDKAWACVRLGYMTYVCYLKFSQNPEWGAQLKETGDRVLVEASPIDQIWGVGLDVEAAAKYAEDRLDESLLVTGELCLESMAWPGLNLLGQALMTVRGLL